MKTRGDAAAHDQVLCVNEVIFNCLRIVSIFLKMFSATLNHGQGRQFYLDFDQKSSWSGHNPSDILVRGRAPHLSPFSF